MQPERFVWRIDIGCSFSVESASKRVLAVKYLSEIYESRNGCRSDYLRKLPLPNAERAAFLSQLRLSFGRRRGRVYRDGSFSRRSSGNFRRQQFSKFIPAWCARSGCRLLWWKTQEAAAPTEWNDLDVSRVVDLLCQRHDIHGRQISQPAHYSNRSTGGDDAFLLWS